MIYEKGEVSGFGIVAKKMRESRNKTIKTNSTFFSKKDTFCYKVFDDRIVFTKPTIDTAERTYKVRSESTNLDTRSLTVICEWLELGKTYNIFTSQEVGEDELTLFLNENSRHDER